MATWLRRRLCVNNFVGLLGLWWQPARAILLMRHNSLAHLILNGGEKQE